MNISSITSSSTAAESRQVTNPQTQMGKDDFLRLLTVQLQYQDPLNPLDNTEFVAQMAQFSSLEQLQNMNQSLESSLSAGTALQAAFGNNLAASLIGKEVEVPTSQIEYDGEHDSTLSYRLDQEVPTAHLRILDARGQLVREVELEGAQRYGSITWDGKSDNGARVPAGAYLVVVQGEDAAGGTVAGEALQTLRVEGARYDAQEATVWAGGREFALSDLSMVREAR